MKLTISWMKPSSKTIQKPVLSPVTKEEYCDQFHNKWIACNLQCKYYKECITYENFLKSLKNGDDKND